MAGQHPSRRQVLEALGLAAVAGTASGFCRWNWAFAQASPHHHTMDAAPRTSARPVAYRPVFFTPAEYSTIEVLAEMILPGTAARSAGTLPHRSAVHRRVPKAADAGATDAGVAEFIDFMVSEEASLQTAFRSGLQWMDQVSGTPHGFLALPPAERTALLERVAYKKNFRDGDQPGQDFFLLARKYTVMGFYTSRIGLESLDYPGLRFYAESPAVPKDKFLQTLEV